MWKIVICNMCIMMTEIKTIDVTESMVKQEQDH